MKPSIPAQPAQPLSAEQQRNNQGHLIRLSMVFASNAAVVWSVIPLFLLSLGATPFHLGLLETGTRGAMAVRMLAAHLLGRVGKVRLMLLCRTAMLLPVAFLATLALRGGGTSLRGSVPPSPARPSAGGTQADTGHGTSAW